MADELGLDKILENLNDIYSKTGMEAYKPTKLLQNLVGSGKLGKKSGEGFHKYS